MHLHSNACAGPLLRRKLQLAQGTYREIARRYGVSLSTVHRWRTRDSIHDRSSRPRSFRTAYSRADEAMLLELRKRGLSLDEVFESAMDEVSGLTRSSLYRLFKRNRLNSRPKPKREAPKTFKTYAPGYVHIDQFTLPQMGGVKRYCFVGIDRATRRTVVQVSVNKSAEAGAAFLLKCTQEFEFNIACVLTDNGSEFTNRCYKGGKAKNEHPFDRICRLKGIRHKLTRPYTPKTNGLVERQNAIVKNGTIRSKTYLNAEAMSQDILDWNERYNHRRQRRIGYKTSCQVTREWCRIRPDLFKERFVQEVA